MTKLLAGVLFLLPPPVLFWGGWILTIAGGGVFLSGISVKNHNAGKSRVFAGFTAAVFGLVMVLFPGHPGFAVALLFLWVACLLWKFFGGLAAFFFS